MNKNIGKIIKERLRSLGKTQMWLAEEADVSYTAVTKWVKNGKISTDKAKKVAQILQISIDSLLLSDSDDSSTKKQLALVYLDSVELDLVTHYREATEIGKTLIKTAAETAPKATSVGIIANNS